MDEKKWDRVKKQVEEELEKVRQRALLAESFDEMEELVVEMGQRLEEVVLSGVAEQREPGGHHRCLECGGWMKRKDRVPRKMKASLGDIEFERERWVCPVCKTTFFPPGSEAET